MAKTTMSVITWVDPNDCDAPHGLDLTAPYHAHKVNRLAEAFAVAGFDKEHSALIGYPLEGRIQLLSGTHRHEAAKLTAIKLPVVLWLRSDIEDAWGRLEEWLHLMKDISVNELETWTREDVERHRRKNQ